MDADRRSPERAPDIIVLGTGATESRLHLEQPTPGTRLHPPGALVCCGWVLTGATLREIAIELDGEALGTATIGLPSADVPHLFPGHPDSACPGFSFVASLPPARPARPS